MADREQNPQSFREDQRQSEGASSGEGPSRSLEGGGRPGGRGPGVQRCWVLPRRLSGLSRQTWRCFLGRTGLTSGPVPERVSGWGLWLSVSASELLGARPLKTSEPEAATAPGPWKMRPESLSV